METAGNLKQYQTMSNNIKQITRAIALAFFVGALPFVFNARAYASKWSADSQEPKAESRKPLDDDFIDFEDDDALAAAEEQPAWARRR